MDSINSFKGYGKVDPVEEASFRKKTRRRLVILTVSVILLLAIIIGAVVGTLIHKNNNNNKSKNNSSNPSTSSSSSAALKAVCNDTPYPDSCYSSISALGSQSHTADPQELFKLSLQVLLTSLENLSTLPDTLLKKTSNDTLKRGLQVCQDVFEDAIDRLNDSISSITLQQDGDNKKKKATTTLSPAIIEDLKTWLSTAITDQETCLDALEELNATALLAETKRQMNNSTQYASNSLSIVTEVLEILSNFNIPIHGRRKLLGLEYDKDGFPEWVGSGDRRLLQEVKPQANVTVAKDGSGDVKTIREAVARIPKKSKTRFVIYVKAGEYVENNILDKSLWNVMIFGDGKDKTLVSASLNFVDGTPTFSTPTFAAVGKGFIAKDMTFRNTAGPQKHQAVAFRSGSDFSVFYRCSFDAFQDTLYSHSNRQFYRECDITGTIDFIFGNAAVVYQNCNIQPRQPLPNQFVTITAQGKKDPNQNTGISIQKCTISPLDKLTAPTYLGRPWKDFSTTIILQSTIGPFLNPAGWIAWVTNVEPPSTIFYAEYQNTGPGATLDKRVKWAGYRTNITAKDASRFTVQNFIQGSQWISETNVIFESNL